MAEVPSPRTLLVFDVNGVLCATGNTTHEFYDPVRQQQRRYTPYSSRSPQLRHAHAHTNAAHSSRSPQLRHAANAPSRHRQASPPPPPIKSSSPTDSPVAGNNSVVQKCVLTPHGSHTTNDKTLYHIERCGSKLFRSRPGVVQLISDLLDSSTYDVAVWSSCPAESTHSLLLHILGAQIVRRLAFVWSREHCVETGKKFHTLKPLSKILTVYGRERWPDGVRLYDDTYDKIAESERDPALGYCHIVPPFLPKDDPVKDRWCMTMHDRLL